MRGCRRLGQIEAALNRFADLNAGKRTSQRELLLIGGERSPLAMRSRSTVDPRDEMHEENHNPVSRKYRDKPYNPPKRAFHVCCRRAR